MNMLDPNVGIGVSKIQMAIYELESLFETPGRTHGIHNIKPAWKRVAQTLQEVTGQHDLNKLLEG
jgi:hypothetical protein